MFIYISEIDDSLRSRARRNCAFTCKNNRYLASITVTEDWQSIENASNATFLSFSFANTILNVLDCLNRVQVLGRNHCERSYGFQQLLSDVWRSNASYTFFFAAYSMWRPSGASFRTVFLWLFFYLLFCIYGPSTCKVISSPSSFIGVTCYKQNYLSPNSEL